MKKRTITRIGRITQSSQTINCSGVYSRSPSYGKGAIWNLTDRERTRTKQGSIKARIDEGRKDIASYRMKMEQSKELEDQEGQIEGSSLLKEG